MERNGEIDWPVGQVNSNPVYLGDWDMTLVWLLVIVALFIGLVGAKSSMGGIKDGFQFGAGVEPSRHHGLATLSGLYLYLFCYFSLFFIYS